MIRVKKKAKPEANDDYKQQKWYEKRLDDQQACTCHDVPAACDF